MGTFGQARVLWAGAGTSGLERVLLGARGYFGAQAGTFGHV